MSDPTLADLKAQLDAIQRSISAGLKNPLIGLLQEMDIPSLLKESQENTELVKTSLAAVQRNLVIIAAKVDRLTASVHESKEKVA